MTQECIQPYNEGKSAIVERFFRTLKKKIHKYLTSISKNLYIDKLDDVVNKYNNIYHRQWGVGYQMWPNWLCLEKGWIEKMDARAASK